MKKINVATLVVTWGVQMMFCTYLDLNPICKSSVHMHRANMLAFHSVEKQVPFRQMLPLHFSTEEVKCQKYFCADSLEAKMSTFMHDFGFIFGRLKCWKTVVQFKAV